jgi:hypothetical protein
MDTVTHIIGVMDPNSLSFRYAFEQLMAHYSPSFHVDGKHHAVKARRIICRPYNTLGARSTCKAILNRGAHWNPHHNSFYMMIMDQVYLLNDMISFKAIDKNTAYGHMYSLGMNIPPTWAIPQYDNSELKESDTVDPDLVFEDYEMFDLGKIGDEVGYPAYLKPQDGGGWVGVTKVSSREELHKAYHASGSKPMNLQKAVEYREFVRTVGIGPQMMPMHYNAEAEFSHDRYLRTATQAVAFNWLKPEEFDEVKKITKVINAFYNWDHNSCETLIAKDTGLCHPIDFANAYPDSKLTSLHFFFPDVVKSMVRWLLFVVVTNKKKPTGFANMWPRYFAVRDKAKAEGWPWAKTLDRYAAIADEHFHTEEFADFCAKHLADFDEKAYEWFSSQAFDSILEAEVTKHFRIARERPGKLAHYRGIHQFWLQCERDRVGLKA